MRSSRFMILLLLSMLSVLGCTPTTNTTLQGVGMTDTVSEAVPNYSNIEMGFGSVWMWMIEGEVSPIPIDVRNISATDMEIVTATIQSQSTGFTITNDAEFPLTSGSNHIVMSQFDASGIEVEIGQPVTRTGVVSVKNDTGGVNEASVIIEIFDAYDVTENQLNLWSTTMWIDAEADGNAVTGKFTIDSSWNESINYIANVSGVGFTVTRGASGVLGTGSSHEIWVEYLPPPATANQTEFYWGLLTIETPDEGDGNYQHQASIRVTVTDPNYVAAGDDDDSAF